MPRPLEIKIFRNRRGSEVPSPRLGDFPVFDGQPLAFRVPMLAATKNATPTLMVVDPKVDLPSALISPAYLPIASNIMRSLHCVVVATQTGGSAGTVGDSLALSFEMAVKRRVAAGTTVLVGVPVATTDLRDAGAAAWAVTPAVDAVNGGLKITVTGAVNKNISWIARIQVIDVPIA